MFLFTGQGVCDENPYDDVFKSIAEGTYDNESEKQTKLVKQVDTLYLLKSDGSILKKYKDVIIVSHRRGRHIIRFIWKGKEVYYEGRVLMEGIEMRKKE